MVTTMSDLICQLSANTGAGGKSFASPSLAPVRAQASMVAVSASLNRGSFMKSPTLGSACQGGILRCTTASRIIRAHGRASLNVISDIGAMSFARWQTTQFLYRIGATSRLKVTSFGDSLATSFAATGSLAESFGAFVLS